MISGHISSFLVQWLILMLSVLMRLTDLSLVSLLEGVSWVLCYLHYVFHVISTRNWCVLSMCSMICFSSSFWIIKQSSLLFKIDLVLLITTFWYNFKIFCYTLLDFRIYWFNCLPLSLLCSIFYSIFPLVLK